MNGNVKLLDFLLKSGIYCIKELEDDHLCPSLLASSLPNDDLAFNITKRIHEAYDACANNVVYCQSTYGYLACASCLKKTIDPTTDNVIVNIEDNNYEPLTQIENDYAEDDLTSTDDQSEMSSYDEDESESDDDFDDESDDDFGQRMVFVAKYKTD